MKFVLKETPYMDIVINEAIHEVLIKQRWKLIDFQLRGQLIQFLGIHKLFYLEKWKEEFKYRAKNIIEEHWNEPNFFLLKLVLIGEETDFYRKNKMTIWTVRFQIDWVLENAHWDVMLSYNPIRSSVNWGKRLIKIDRLDTNIKRTGTYTRQIGLLHEFGHTIGNSSYAISRQRKILHGDEYNKVSPYYLDEKSIMNIGNELRFRHIDYILLELETMIPNVKFEHF